MVAHASEEGKPIYPEIFRGSGRLAYEEERAIKKALMMREWISGRATKDIENSFYVYSGVIKRVGEDFSLLCEALCDLSKESGWPKEVTEKISVLSEKLAQGLPEKALLLGRMRVNGLGRGHILRLVREGIDSEEAIRDLGEK